MTTMHYDAGFCSTLIGLLESCLPGSGEQDSACIMSPWSVQIEHGNALITTGGAS